MIPYMFCVMERLRMNEEQFFRLAAYWRFKKEMPVVGDVVTYKTIGELPKYVVEYLHFLQGNEDFVDPKPNEKMKCLKSTVLDALPT